MRLLPNLLAGVFRRLGRLFFGLSQSRIALLDPTAVLHETASIENIRQTAESIRIGAHSHIRGQLLTFAHGGTITIGSYCYLGEDSRIWSAKEISIGNRVLIAHLVSIFDSHTHPINPESRHEQFRAIINSGHPGKIDLGEKPVRIEDDAWIGCHSVILRGVTIGRGAIIGAGSVVTKDIPQFTIAAGNPAAIIRELTPEERCR